MNWKTSINHFNVEKIILMLFSSSHVQHLICLFSLILFSNQAFNTSSCLQSNQYTSQAKIELLQEKLIHQIIINQVESNYQREVEFLIPLDTLRKIQRSKRNKILFRKHICFRKLRFENVTATLTESVNYENPLFITTLFYFQLNSLLKI